MNKFKEIIKKEKEQRTHYRRPESEIEKALHDAGFTCLEKSHAWERGFVIQGRREVQVSCEIWKEDSTLCDWKLRITETDADGNETGHCERIIPAGIYRERDSLRFMDWLGNRLEDWL